MVVNRVTVTQGTADDVLQRRRDGGRVIGRALIDRRGSPSLLDQAFSVDDVESVGSQSTLIRHVTGLLMQCFNAMLS